MNKLIIIGNLTRDPEERVTADGRVVVNFTVAVNRIVKQGDHPQADFFRVSAWDMLGDRCGKYLSKGKKVCVEGAVRAHAYTDERGQARASLEVTAREVHFLTPKGQQSDGDQIPPNDNPPPEYDNNGGFTDVDLDETPFP